ncbi:MAG: tRNA dihydrouridine synthase DusB [Desulfobulbaceae bacterium]|uniref:tRNA-dihydrouridine synthase n=1 Tax=Candidatus Desulfatifera sulfidica TaxID=2841691 RepID=A0A8J6N9C7_9BACT|nr:tRNA dihydrouridine synthase DusB [Candidatus Desulfatifera sulfidica]
MLKIGPLQLDSPLILAPLAGYSDLPFRLLCREYGAGLVVSEMISCHGMVYQQPNTLAMLATVPAERPLSIQLFGADPMVMGQAAALLNKFHPDLIDINMGCPVRKVTKRGAGSALMKTPALARQIIEAVVRESDVPVTVKTRIGIDQKTMTAVKFAQMAEDSGAAAVTIHGRTWAQGFTGLADWQAIAEVKKAVSIPVIGNGDIDDYQTAQQRLDEAGCDGVMIGRGALGNPWAFSASGRPATLEGLLPGVRRHLELMAEHLPTDRMLGAIKNQIGRYFKELPHSSQYRKLVCACSDFATLRQEIDALGQQGTLKIEDLR